MRSQFTWHPHFAIKHFFHLVVYKIIVLSLQYSDLTVHLGTSEEIDNCLSMLCYIGGKGFLVRRLYRQYSLWRSIYIFTILHLGLSIDVTYIDHYNIANQL